MIKSILNRILGNVLRVFGLNRFVFNLIEYLKMTYLNVKFGSQLKHVVKRKGFTKSKIPLFCCVRNEMHRIPFFLKFYRNLGVDHFFFIDNNSDDNFVDYMKEQTDCSVWFTKKSYKKSNFGMWWCNYLLKKYGVGKWCVTVDPDEFFVYPKYETRNLVELTNHLDGIGQKTVFSLMIDAYSNKEVKKTKLTKNDNPFEVCPYFDRYNYTQRLNPELNNVWIQGGVRMRKFFRGKPGEAPAQNKVPLIKWRKNYRYLSSMHHTNSKQINCTIKNDSRFLSGAVFHFKYVSKLKEKVEEEMIRKQHYNSGEEYKMYKQHDFEMLYDPHWSILYKNSDQLINLKMLHRGEWF